MFTSCRAFVRRYSGPVAETGKAGDKKATPQRVRKGVPMGKGKRRFIKRERSQYHIISDADHETAVCGVKAGENGFAIVEERGRVLVAQICETCRRNRKGK